MTRVRPLKIGITCYPSVGGSGILACALGVELARRGHEVHFISYERPFRMPEYAPRLFFHPVMINDYGLFKYPDYTLPLSVKMAEVTRDFGLDLLHVHYAVPHATAAILARSMLPSGQQPKVVTTLHGTDTTLLGRDPGYGPAIRHALISSDAVTTVSNFLRRETEQLLTLGRPIDVIHNFFVPRPTTRSRTAVRRDLGLKKDEALVLHASNLRPIKRIDLLLDAVARVPAQRKFKLLILAGGNFAPFQAEVMRLGLQSRLIIRENVLDIEEYFQAADLGLYTSEMESFCLGILEGMAFGYPSVSTAVGGIPEVVNSGKDGLLVPFGDVDGLAKAIDRLLRQPVRRRAMGHRAKIRAKNEFSAAAIIPQYEALYRRVCAGPATTSTS